jgi:hypothetical protein
MAKQAEPKEVSVGVCRFCEQEFAKSKMTQHLKTCKTRQDETSKQEGDKERLFHLLVEGKYRPEYWMHLEVPAEMTLSELDDFLRAIWLECCGHLSEFEIDGTSYEASPDDDWGLDFSGLQLMGNDGAEGEDEDEEDEGTMPSMEEMAAEISKQVAAEFQTDLKEVPIEQIEQRLEQMFAENMPPGMSAVTMPTLRPFLNVMAQSLQQGTLAHDLEEAEVEEEEEEEGGMEVELGDVLEVGKKFSYVYDFGSSSTLNLRVIAEREGLLPEDDEAEDEDEEDEEDDYEDEDTIDLVVMARNEPPALKCHICGQPATHVPSASEYDVLSEVALCDTHAEESEDPDELLPIVNSPRTGICGYTGDEDEDWEAEEWDEDEDDDE